MEIRTLGSTMINVSEIGIGTLTIGPWQLNLPVEEGAAVLRYAMENGILFWDTAEYYQTYAYIKRALKGSRFDPVIASKSLARSGEEMKRAVEQSRLEMGRDYIDLFLLHEVRTGSDWSDRSEAWQTLCEAKEKGLVKAIGISTHHTDVTDFAASIPEVDVVFPLINFRSLGIRTGAQPGSKEEMESAIKKAAASGKGIFAMKALGGGNLTGSYQKALRYIRRISEIDSLMLGLGSFSEIDRIRSFVEGSLDTDYVPDLTGKQIVIDQGDCLGCGACLERCPNHAIFYNKDGLADVDQSRCLCCGYCTPQCPVLAIRLR